MDQQHDPGAAATGAGRTAVLIGLNAVIIAVTDEVPRVLVVHHADHALATPALRDAATDSEETASLPFGPFSPATHRTLEQGTRDWVSEQAGLPLGHIEQLYTFGDRYRDPRELGGGPRVVSIGYLALVREGRVSGSGGGEWRSCYDFLPWEDWREGPPAMVGRVMRPRLAQWIDQGPEPAIRSARRERVAVTFGLADAGWNPAHVLDRYELLYEIGLVAEARRDAWARALYAARVLGAEPPPPTPSPEMLALGPAMMLDHRRILATALGRLRGKLDYRPVVFELLPRNFTLLHLQRVVEALAGVRLHKQNFRRLVINGGLVENTGRIEENTGGRPAALFRFRRDVLRERPSPGVALPGWRGQG